MHFHQNLQLLMQLINHIHGMHAHSHANHSACPFYLENRPKTLVKQFFSHLVAGYEMHG